MPSKKFLELKEFSDEELINEIAGYGGGLSRS